MGVPFMGYGFDGNSIGFQENCYGLEGMWVYMGIAILESTQLNKSISYIPYADLNQGSWIMMLLSIQG